MRLATLRALGFDLSTHIPFTRYFRPRCSQCAALAVNGMPTHERGCPNTRHACAGCDALIPAGQRYCPDCRA
jgi:hypothetical protein